MTLIGSLRRLFTRRDKKIIAFLLLLSILVSVFETVGISALMLFITVATNFELIQKNHYMVAVQNLIGFSHPANFVIALGLVLIVFYCVRAVLNILLVYSMSNFSQMRQHRFATEIFERFLLLDYKEFTQKSAATFSQVIFGFTANATQVINGLLNIMSEGFTIIAIYAMLFYVNWKMTLVLSLLLSIKILVIVKAFSGRITSAGSRSQRFSVEMSKVFNETFGNYKFLKLLADFRKNVSVFKTLNYGFARANNVNTVWQGLPRFILETMGFSILIGVIVYVLYMYRNAHFVIPTVSMYALAFYRFLPSVNKILMGYNQVIFNKHALVPLSQYLSLEPEQAGNVSVSFEKTVELRKIAFSYSSSKKIFHDVSFTIRRGEKIGFVGASGAGKTTLIDIIIGLLSPNEGSINIDDKKLSRDNLYSWRRMIGYIPQNIYLFDGTAAENVCCGRLRDENLLIRALKQANMYKFLMANGGLETRVGEAGIQLSGGQRQRLAIARALYGDPKILVLDEATSSLDNENEEAIMQEIYDSSADRTMLIIAHRLSTIALCDRVLEVCDGLVYERSIESVVGRVHRVPEITKQESL